MSNSIQRIVSVLVVSCLVADPAFTQAFTQTHTPTTTSLDHFQSEALTEWLQLAIRPIYDHRSPAFEHERRLARVAVTIPAILLIVAEARGFHAMHWIWYSAVPLTALRRIKRPKNIETSEITFMLYSELKTKWTPVVNLILEYWERYELFLWDCGNVGSWRYDALIAFRGLKPVGVCAFQYRVDWISRKRAKGNGIFVDEKERRNGFGTLLRNQLYRLLLEKGFTRFSFNARADKKGAVPFAETLMDAPGVHSVRRHIGPYDVTTFHIDLPVYVRGLTTNIRKAA